MPAFKLLLTGASGYIGGSVLTALLNSNKENIKQLSISALVRGDKQVQKIREIGANPIEFRDLDDTEVIEKAASEHDVVIHTTSGFHTPSALAIVRGLSARKTNTGNEVHFIHISGTSNIAQLPTNRDYKELSDNDDVHAYESNLNEGTPYFQRTTELLTVNAAVESNIKIYVVMPPTIYGFGSGPFNRVSTQIPYLMKEALKIGRPIVVESGEGVWDHVHISDLATLYEMLVDEILNGKDLPHGKEGVYFTSAGRSSWIDVSRNIGKAGVSLGVLKSEEPLEISIEDAVKAFGWPQLALQLGLASNSLSKADRAKELLGWTPQKTAKDWEESFVSQFEQVIAASKQ